MSRRAAFPYQIAPTGRTALVDDSAALPQTLAQIVFVELGERLNRPDFGCQIEAMTFATGLSEVTGAAGALIHGALRQWADPHYEVTSVDIRLVDARAEVTIDYREALSQSTRRVMISRETGQ